MREREHGTIEHLLVMPLTPFQIALAKVWANGLVILIGFALSMFFMVEGLLDVPIACSRLLLLLGATVYLFAAAAIGILLGTLARTMAQFALLIMLTIMPMMMLSGGMSPIENQPDFLRPITWFLPSRHFMAFSGHNGGFGFCVLRGKSDALPALNHALQIGEHPCIMPAPKRPPLTKFPSLWLICINRDAARRGTLLLEQLSCIASR